MEKDNYENFKNFIISDIKLKKEMYDIRPPQDTDALNLREIVKYTDNLYDSLKFIIRELKKMIIPYDNGGAFSKKLDELGKTWQKELIKCKINLNKLNAFYKNQVTDMNMDLIDNVKKEISGYYYATNLKLIFDKTKTINEFLHVLHSYVMINLSVLQGVPLISEKKLACGYPVYLRGEENEISRLIFDNFPHEIDTGGVDIVSLGKIPKIVAMLRDRGHALMLEIEYDDNDILVNYFIPKLCNIQMINMLPGINKVKDNADMFSGATGRFVTTKDKIVTDLFSFIEKVPMDSDIPVVADTFNHR